MRSLMIHGLADVPMVAKRSFWISVPLSPMFVFRVHTCCLPAVNPRYCQLPAALQVRPPNTKRPSPCSPSSLLFLILFFPLTASSFLQFFPLDFSSTFSGWPLSHFLPTAISSSTIVRSPTQTSCPNRCRSIPYTARVPFERIFRFFFIPPFIVSLHIQFNFQSSFFSTTDLCLSASCQTSHSRVMCVHIT